MSDGVEGSRQEPEFRPAARVLLIDDSDCVLLFNVGVPQQSNFRLGAPPQSRHLWITPGGGLDPDETREDAALRELYEETGLCAAELGPCIWKRRHTWQWEDRWIESDEWFYLLRAPAFDVVPTAPDEWEMQYVLGHRWWSLPDMISHRMTEIFVPRSLPELLTPILAGDIPKQPVEVGI